MKKIRAFLGLIAVLLVVSLSFTSCEALLGPSSSQDGTHENGGNLENAGNNDNGNQGTENEGNTDNGNQGTENEGNTDNGNQGTENEGNTDNGNQGTENECNQGNTSNKNDKPSINGGVNISIGGFSIPQYSDSPYYVINNNNPFFEDDDIVTEAYERYGVLDSLGRCTVAMACIDRSLMPPEGDNRGSLSVDPTGWLQAQYDAVPGKYLYNRSHLIGWQLTDEDSNKYNLVTGTRYMNASGMLPFENMVADYIKETGNHVIYRVTPIFEGNNLLASGVQIEAYSVEDNGYGICFNVFVYNVQPDIGLDYATGESWLNDGSEELPEDEGSAGVEKDYILNTNSKKIHETDCSAAKKISAANRQEYTGYIEDLHDMGYTDCGICDPT